MWDGMQWMLVEARTSRIWCAENYDYWFKFLQACFLTSNAEVKFQQTPSLWPVNTGGIKTTVTVHFSGVWFFFLLLLIISHNSKWNSKFTLIKIVGVLYCSPETVFHDNLQEYLDQYQPVLQCHTLPPTHAKHLLRMPNSSYPKIHHLLFSQYHLNIAQTTAERIEHQTKLYCFQKIWLFFYLQQRAYSRFISH